MFIHGNPACRGVFRKQFNVPALGGYRLIALDLAGHGDSEDAIDRHR
ncbi:MAG: alpha/beta fold hydrolase [Proteobacteria bacterium]|nr:alpha/beta fold hydrolase [Pseudomonadota bacterium]